MMINILAFGHICHPSACHLLRWRVEMAQLDAFFGRGEAPLGRGRFLVVAMQELLTLTKVVMREQIPLQGPLQPGLET